MTNVLSIAASQLSNGDFYQLIETTVAIASTEPTVHAMAMPLQNALPAMLLSFKKEKQTQETVQVVAVGKLRDRAFAKIKRITGAYMVDDAAPDKIAAAQAITSYIKLYGMGKFVKGGFNKKTASFTNFIADVQAHIPAAIALLGLAGSLIYLQQQNNHFKDLYKSRGDAKAIQTNVLPFFILRDGVLELFKNFTADLQSLQRIHPTLAPKVEAIAMRLNVEIAKYKLMLPTTTAAQKPPKD